VILVEAVITPRNDPHFAKWLDLEVLLLPGGRQRTEAEFVNLLEQAGFRLTRVVQTKSPVCVLEAEKLKLRVSPAQVPTSSSILALV
jgi:O-methyltransferase